MINNYLRAVALCATISIQAAQESVNFFIANDTSHSLLCSTADKIKEIAAGSSEIFQFTSLAQILAHEGRAMVLSTTTKKGAVELTSFKDRASLQRLSLPLSNPLYLITFAEDNIQVTQNRKIISLMPWEFTDSISEVEFIIIAL